MTEPSFGRSRSSAALIAFGLLSPHAAQAHVKWFCGPIDQSIAPTPLREVLTPLFATLLVLFTLLVCAGALLDVLAARFLPWPVVKSDTSRMIGDVIVRLGVSAYAFSLWLNLAVVLWADQSLVAILTPEMLENHRAIGILQLAIAIAALIPRLSMFAGIGLITLFGMGVIKFGPFYMIDYTFFLGLAAYLILGDRLVKRHVDFSWMRVPILIGSLSLSLMWTAVEKFLFPDWTILVLRLHPGITAGFPVASVATIAGFVEFSLAFYLLVGREILGRIGAIMLMIVFVLAMPEFGLVDVFGHIPVIIILMVALVEGETPLQILCRGHPPHFVTSSRKVVSLYVATLTALSLLYYGLHAASVWI